MCLKSQPPSGLSSYTGQNWRKRKRCGIQKKEKYCERKTKAFESDSLIRDLFYLDFNLNRDTLNKYARTQQTQPTLLCPLPHILNTQFVPVYTGPYIKSRWRRLYFHICSIITSLGIVYRGREKEVKIQADEGEKRIWDVGRTYSHTGKKESVGEEKSTGKLSRSKLTAETRPRLRNTSFLQPTNPYCKFWCLSTLQLRSGLVSAQ